MLEDPYRRQSRPSRNPHLQGCHYCNGSCSQCKYGSYTCARLSRVRSLLSRCAPKNGENVMAEAGGSCARQPLKGWAFVAKVIRAALSSWHANQRDPTSMRAKAFTSQIKAAERKTSHRATVVPCMSNPNRAPARLEPACSLPQRNPTTLEHVEIPACVYQQTIQRSRN